MQKVDRQRGINNRSIKINYNTQSICFFFFALIIVICILVSNIQFLNTYRNLESNLESTSTFPMPIRGYNLYSYINYFTTRAHPTLKYRVVDQRSGSPFVLFTKKCVDKQRISLQKIVQSTLQSSHRIFYRDVKNRNLFQRLVTRTTTPIPTQILQINDKPSDPKLPPRTSSGITRRPAFAYRCIAFQCGRLCTPYCNCTCTIPVCSNTARWHTDPVKSRIR